MRRRTVLLISADDCGWSDLRLTLGEMAEVQLVGEVRSMRQVQRLTTTPMQSPDVVIAAARVEDVSTLPLLTAIRREYWPATRLLVFACHFDPNELLAFADLGVRGYFLWSDLSPEAIGHCLRVLLMRDLVISSGTVAVAFLKAQQYHQQAAEPIPQTSDTPHTKLTSREREVLRLLGSGHNNKGIAATLGIGTRTAEFHVQNVLGKLGAHSRGEALRYAHRHEFPLPPTISGSNS